MSAIDKGRTVLRLQYQVASLPLRFFEQRTRALGTDSQVHLLAERVMATLDGGVGRLLGDNGLREQAEREGGHVDSIKRASRLEWDAQSRRAEADRAAAQAATRAEARREQAREQQNERVSSVVRETQADRREVGERVREGAQSTREAADSRAEERQRSARAEQEQRDKAIAARTEQVIEEPQQELKEAAGQRREAARERAEADALDKLAEQERAARKGTANSSS